MGSGKRLGTGVGNGGWQQWLAPYIGKKGREQGTRIKNRGWEQGLKKELETGVGNGGMQQSLETRIGNKGWELRFGKGVKEQKHGNRGW